VSTPKSAEIGIRIWDKERELTAVPEGKIVDCGLHSGEIWRTFGADAASFLM
jgi:hypothetical protein